MSSSRPLGHRSWFTVPFVFVHLFFIAQCSSVAVPSPSRRATVSACAFSRARTHCSTESHAVIASHARYITSAGGGGVSAHVHDADGASEANVANAATLSARSIAYVAAMSPPLDSPTV
jgi:hypothetical protein